MGNWLYDQPRAVFVLFDTCGALDFVNSVTFAPYAAVRDFSCGQYLAGPVVGFIDTHRLSVHSAAKAEAPGDRAAIRKWLAM